MVGTVGTFAAWDQLSDTQTGTVTFKKPVVVTVDKLTFENDSRALGDTLPTATAPVTIKVAELPEGAEEKYELQITPAVTGTNASQVEVDQASTVALDELVDDSYTTNVKVTAKDDALDGAGTEVYSVEVEAKLVEKP